MSCHVITYATAILSNRYLRERASICLSHTSTDELIDWAATKVAFQPRNSKQLARVRLLDFFDIGSQTTTALASVPAPTDASTASASATEQSERDAYSSPGPAIKPTALTTPTHVATGSQDRFQDRSQDRPRRLKGLTGQVIYRNSNSPRVLLLSAQVLLEQYLSVRLPNDPRSRSPAPASASASAPASGVQIVRILSDVVYGESYEIAISVGSSGTGSASLPLVFSQPSSHSGAPLATSVLRDTPTKVITRRYTAFLELIEDSFCGFDLVARQKGGLGCLVQDLPVRWENDATWAGSDLQGSSSSSSSSSTAAANPTKDIRKELLQSWLSERFEILLSPSMTDELVSYVSLLSVSLFALSLSLCVCVCVCVCLCVPSTNCIFILCSFLFLCCSIN